MKLTLTKEEIKELFISVIANGGLSLLDFELEFSRELYKKSPTKIHEDSLFNVLEQGGTITFVDEENDGEYTTEITMETLKEKLENLEDGEFISHVITILKGEDDATNGYEVIQYILFGESIFG